MKTVVAWLLMLGAALPLAAHEGHEHKDPDAVPAAPTPTSGNRLALSTARVELLAVREADGSLSVYADDYASNAPLNGVSLRLTIAGRSLQAAELAPGSWQVPAAVLGDEAQPQAGFELRSAGWTEVLSAALPARPAVADTGSKSGGGLVLMLLPLLAALALQRRGTPEQT